MKIKNMVAVILAVSALSSVTVHTVGVAETVSVADEDLKPGDVFVDGNLKYYVGNNKTLEVDDLVNRDIENLVIPGEVKGHKVTSIFAGMSNDYKPINGLANCTSLKSVIIPDTMEYISEGAFSGCISLESITINGGNISYGAFRNCTALTNVQISDKVTAIASGAFEGCTSLENVEISEENADFCSVDGVIYNKDKTMLIRHLEGKKDTSFTIPNTVNELDHDAFSGCTSLKSVTIPESVTKIGNYIFYNCTSLTEVDLPENLTAIKGSMFEGCTALESVTIPESVTEIWFKAFFNCTSLKSLTFPQNAEIPRNVGNFIFWNCASLERIDVSGDNANICSVDGVLYSKDKTMLFCYPAAKKGTVYTIPDSVTKIDAASFYNASLLNNIIIPNSIKEISRNAFQGCSSLTDITVPNSVTLIDMHAFDDCTSLKNVNFSGTKEAWASIDVREYNECLTNAKIICTDGIINERDTETSEPTTSEPTASEPTTSEPTTSEPTESTVTPGSTDPVSEPDSSTNAPTVLEATLKNVDSENGLSGEQLDKQLFGDSGRTWEQVEKIEFTSDKLFSVLYKNDNGDWVKLGGEPAARAAADGEWNTAWTLCPSVMAKDKYAKVISKDGIIDVTAKIYIKSGTEKPSDGTDQNPTGIALAIAPVVLAASAAVVIFKKKK